MLKTKTLHLPGRDADCPITITELPALVADRHARTALLELDASPDGGVIALAFQHGKALKGLGARAVDLLAPFVSADRQPSTWRNLMTAQQAALLLHAGFMVGRPQIEVPVGMQADGIRQGAGEDGVHFCSPGIAAVLHSGRATYRELETVLSTEDVYNLTELLNVESIREWRAHQTTRQT